MAPKLASGVRPPLTLGKISLLSGVMQMALKRIHKEIADIKKEDLGGMTIEPTDNLFVWNASIPGQEGSPYEGGLFRLDIHLPPDYPCVATIPTLPELSNFVVPLRFSAPKILFVTRYAHKSVLSSDSCTQPSYTGYTT